MQGHVVVELWHACTGAVTPAVLTNAPAGVEARAAAFAALMAQRAAAGFDDHSDDEAPAPTPAA